MKDLRVGSESKICAMKDLREDLREGCAEGICQKVFLIRSKISDVEEYEERKVVD